MTSTGDIAAIVRAVLAALPAETLRTANSVAEESAKRLRWATGGTNHDAPQAALGHINDGIGHTENALRSLAEITERLTAYLAVLEPGSTGATSGTSTGGTPAGGGAGAGSGKPVVGPAAKQPISTPNKRHDLNKIGKSSRPDSVNTVILPGTDVEGDLEAIRRGEATWLAQRSRYEINGRTYGVEANGTTYPDSGPGFVKLSRGEYQALKGVIQAGGDMEKRSPTLTLNESITEADWQKAAEVYQHHRHASSEGTA